MPSLLLLGRDHQRYGSFEAVSVTERVAAAISIGADPESPSLKFKDDPDTLNEDALCVVIDGTRTALAVADAHYGPESSHVLIEQLCERWNSGVPVDFDGLADVANQLGVSAETDSETALLMAVHDSATGEGFGFSIGDASLIVVGSGRDGSPENPRNHRYVSAFGDDAEAVAFSFVTKPGDLVLAFTDGIDECHYRHPETSIRPHHIDQVVASAAGDPLLVVEQLSQLALDGVDGNPGGQDNIAIVALAV